MSDPAPDDLPPLAQPPRRNYFSPWVTALCSIVMAAYVVWLPLGAWLDSESPSPLDQLERPEESLERLVTRELDFYDAVHNGSRWEWWLYKVVSGGEDPVEQSAAWYAELVRIIDSPAAQLRRVILLAESGHADRVWDVIAAWDDDAGKLGWMARWVKAAYLGTPLDVDTGKAFIGEVRQALPHGWFADTLVARLAERVGDPLTHAAAEAAIATRGQRLLLRVRVLMGAGVLVLVLGGLGLGWVLARRIGWRVAYAPLPPVWTIGEGFALFVRGVSVPTGTVVLVFFVFFLLRRELPFETVLFMAAHIPLFVWVTRYLSARDTSVAATFGLVLTPGRSLQFARVTLILVAVQLLGDAVIGAAGGLLHLEPHWTDGFSESLLWKPVGPFLAEAFHAVVWAPVIEEITFRGLLFATLRMRLGVGPAALLSAAAFSIPHSYGVVGSASVLWSGVLWAVAYERTRSLLPGLLAHSANNLISTLWVVGLLRM